MVVSPILIIIVSAVLIATAFLYIFNNPKKPLFTGVFLILLLISVLFTFAINVELSSTGTVLHTENNIFKALTAFVTMESTPPKQLLQQSYDTFCIIDISLIVLSVIISVLEMRVLFKNNKVKHEVEK
ncbi:MAG: hypothetical protein UIM53_04400 [Acutalibacteraceae bacterium]|nr:hypothetical protein [Acutalibacteraceae bacterium]